MTRLPHVSRHQGTIVAVCCYLSATVVLIWFSAFISSSPAIAETSVSVVPTPCPTRIRPPVGSSPIQNMNGTIKSISGSILQITPTIPGAPINASYSSSTRITEQTLVRTSPASVLLKGVDISVQAIQNPNGTFNARLITLMQGNQPDNPNCFAGGSVRQKSASGTPPSVKGNQPIPGGRPDDAGDCFTSRGSASRPVPGALTPTPSSPSSEQPICRMISGTVVQLQGTTLTIIDRQRASHAVILTSGTTATKIIKMAPALPNALKIGASIMIMGPINKGVIAASRITIEIGRSLP